MILYHQKQTKNGLYILSVFWGAKKTVFPRTIIPTWNWFYIYSWNCCSIIIFDTICGLQLTIISAIITSNLVSIHILTIGFVRGTNLCICSRVIICWIWNESTYEIFFCTWDTSKQLLWGCCDEKLKKKCH